VFVQQVKHIFYSQGLLLIKEATETRFPNCQVRGHHFECFTELQWLG